MLYAKFQDHRTLVSGEVHCLKNLAIYGFCSHLGHVTKTIFTKQICSLFQRRLWKIMFIHMYIALGQATPCGHNFFKNYKYSVNLVSAASFSHFITL